MSRARHSSLLVYSGPLPFIAAALLITACPPPTPTYTVGGTVTGLFGTGLVLQNNGGDDLAITANGSFTFPTALASGATYVVTVKTQPASPSQTCGVANATGTVASADITGVAVTCTTNTYAVGGTVSGLAGTGLVLQNNGGDDLAAAANGAFAFATPMTSGSSYSATVKTQPASPSQTCGVANATGTVAGADITHVAVTCTTNTYAVGGTVSGLAGTGLVLRKNGGDDLAVTANGAFTFATPMTSGSSYSVTVKTQPASPSQLCVVSNATGTVASADIADVAVTCTSMYSVGGTVSGLAGSGLVLRNNGGGDLSVTANGTFTFATRMTSGSSYSVSVKTQPTSPAQTCGVANATGTIAGADITNVAVSCTTNTYAVGGTVSGLTGSGLVLQDNGGDDLAVAADGAFAFATRVASGSSYSVTVRTQPTGPAQTCLVANATGTIASADITNVAVTCMRRTYAVGGTVSGLAGSGLVLQNNGGDDLAVTANGTFTFATPLAAGASYSVFVAVPPSSPRQLCTVTNGAGTIVASPVTNVAVACTSVYSLGGTLTGASMDGIVLASPGQPDLAVDVGATAFTFATYVTAGTSYDVTVKTRPALLDCTVENGSGTFGNADVTNVVVRCTRPWTAVAAGGNHTAGITADGTLWAWGNNTFGQLGDGTTTDRLSPVQVGAGFASVAAGQYFTVALKTDGTLWAWGDNTYGQLGVGDTTMRLRPVQVGAGFASAAAGFFHAMAVKADGALWAWGHNTYGQLGDGTTTDRHNPVQVGAGFASVAAGDSHTVALKTDGTLWAWGRNNYGQLGDGTTTNQPGPVQVGDGFASAAAGAYHTVAVKTDGTLWAWGRNDFGQLGDGTTTQRLGPVQVGSGFASLAAGDYHTVAVKTDGTLWAWGYNDYGQLGDGATTNQPGPVQVGAGFASVAAGGYHTVALKADGTLWTWGRNHFGQIGDGATTNQPGPVQVGAGFASVAAGRSHTVAVKTDGTLWAWGRNTYGQLGDGTLTNRLGPVQVGAGFASAAAGDYHSVAVKTDGTLWAWGSNSAGQLGDGTTTARLGPVQVGAGFASVAAGSSHTVAMETNGTLWAWGSNSAGQLGDGTTTRRLSPVQVGSGFASVAAGTYFTMAVKTDGTLWAWGDNTYGQLGDGTTTNKLSPVQIGSGFASIAAGDSHTVALKTDGTLWAWGGNTYGQLGDGTTTPRVGPVQVGAGFASAAVGYSHTVALKTDGTVWAWGRNNYGQLGDGTTTSQLSPVQVGAGFASLAADGYHTMAVKADDTLWAWGSNQEGQLADPASAPHYLPILIP